MMKLGDILPYVIFAAVIAGCAGSSETESMRNAKTLAYEIGVPNFDLEAIVRWQEGNSGTEINLGIPLVSLSFVKVEMGYQAIYAVTAQAIDDDNPVTEENWMDTVVVKEYAMTESVHPRLFTRWLPVPPGDYELRVVVEDQNSYKKATRSQSIHVDALRGDTPTVSSLWLESMGVDSVFVPYVAFHVPADVESLSAVAVVYNAPDVSSAVVRSSLFRIRADTSVASPPFAFSPMKGTIEYQGLDYRSRDTVRRTMETIAESESTFKYRFLFPPLGKGIYLLEEDFRFGGATAAENTEIERQREISIKSANFPRPSTLEELLQPLVYLTSKSDLEEIQAASTKEEKRAKFEEFWLRWGRNKQGAASLIKQYYTRVQEANLLFTNFKEGWKTDRGMIYIVFGPPIAVEHIIAAEIWRYGYDESDPRTSFYFERAGGYVPDTAFPNYVLRREPYYEYPWRKAIDRWHSGFVR